MIESNSQYLGEFLLEKKLSLGDFGFTFCDIIGYVYYSNKNGHFSKITSCTVNINNAHYEWLHRLNPETLERLEVELIQRARELDYESEYDRWCI